MAPERCFLCATMIFALFLCTPPRLRATRYPISGRSHDLNAHHPSVFTRRRAFANTLYSKVQMTSSTTSERPQHLDYFSNTVKEHPSFRGNVKLANDESNLDLLVDNSPYSRIYHLTVSTASNKPIYDIPAIAEPTGAICIAVNAHGEIALLRQWRSVPASKAGTAVFRNPDTKSHGFLSIEVPRGFPEAGENGAQAAAREAREELGLIVKGVRELGWVNCNTALFLTDVPMFAVLVGEEKASDKQDEGEHIVGVEWCDLEEVKQKIRGGEIRCGMTLAAISFLLAFESSILDFVVETS